MHLTNAQISSGCFTGMEYQSCGLDITCDHIRGVTSCRNSSCHGGCFCSDGTTLDDGVCVHPYMCPSKYSETC